MSADWSNQFILNRFGVETQLPGRDDLYRAWDVHLDRPVLLHVLPNLPEDDLRREYEDKAQALERLPHPGLLVYGGIFEATETAFWAEAYVDGPSLRTVLAATQGAPLSMDEAFTYLKALSAELAALHAAGWVHGDLRPENVILGRDGSIHLGGLFSACKTGDTAPAGDPRYTAPEQADGKALSPASDVYALGRILYEMLAGSLPAGPALPNLRDQNPDVPEFLARILPKALAENSAERIKETWEFYLTACLATKMEANSLPDSVPGDPDSPSRRALAAWTFLPPLEPPYPSAKKSIEQEKQRPSVWTWLLAGLAVIGVGLIGWQFLSAPIQAQGQVSVTVALPASIPASTELVGPATDTPVPTLGGPNGLSGRIVFTCTRGDLNHLCMVAPTGGKVALLTNLNAHDYYPVFSPDGYMVLFASNRGGAFDLYLMLLKTDILTQVTTDLGGVSSASFSPDGLQIAFSNSTDGKPAAIWLVDRDGKNAHMLYKGTGNIVSPVWSPNGKSIAFAMSGSDPQYYDIYILDLASNQAAAVTPGHLDHVGGSVDWSPDGRQLLVFAGTGSDHDIYTIDITSGAVKQLTNGGNNAAPAYSPDGRWIVFNSMRASENANIFIMRPDGSDVQQLTDDAEPDWQPKWGR